MTAPSMTVPGPLPQDAAAASWGFVDAAMSRWEPIMWAFLDAFAGLTATKGRVLDAGCGPGRVTAHLSDKGVDISGIDLSPRLIAAAQTYRPDIDFTVGSITQLPIDPRHGRGELRTADDTQVRETPKGGEYIGQVCPRSGRVQGDFHLIAAKRRATVSYLPAPCVDPTNF